MILQCTKHAIVNRLNVMRHYAKQPKSQPQKTTTITFPNPRSFPTLKLHTTHKNLEFRTRHKAESLNTNRTFSAHGALDRLKTQIALRS